MLIDHVEDNLGSPRLYPILDPPGPRCLGQMGYLGPGIDGTRRLHLGQPWKSQVVLGQMGHLGPGTDHAHRPCWEQPWKSQVVLGQMGHLGPGTDDALTDHVGNNLRCPWLS